MLSQINNINHLTLKVMEGLGYYAKDKNNNLFKFRWGTNDEFEILIENIWYTKNPNDYEILEIGFFTADSK